MRHPLRAIFVAVLFVAFLCYYFLKKDEPAKQLDAPTSQLNLINDQKYSALLTSLRDLVKNASSVPVKASESDFSISIPDIRSAFVAMHDLRTYYDKDKIRNELLDELLKNQDTIKLATQIITNNEFARRTFGDDQAAARVYAIKILERKAEQGDILPLQNTTANLARALTDKKEVSKGEKQDLDDLITASLAREDKKTVMEQLPEYFGKLGYSKKLQDIYADAFFFALREAFPDEQVRAALGKLIDS